MDFKIEEKEKDLTLVFSGKLDSITAPQAEDQVLPMLENSVYETITIDCTDLEYIASSGIRLFFAILKDGYQRYLKEQEKEKIKEAENFDYSKGMRLSYGDE